MKKVAKAAAKAATKAASKLVSKAKATPKRASGGSSAKGSTPSKAAPSRPAPSKAAPRTAGSGHGKGASSQGKSVAGVKRSRSDAAASSSAGGMRVNVPAIALPDAMGGGVESPSKTLDVADRGTPRRVALFDLRATLTHTHLVTSTVLTTPNSSHPQRASPTAFALHASTRGRVRPISPTTSSCRCPLDEAAVSLSESTTLRSPRSSPTPLSSGSR